MDETEKFEGEKGENESTIEELIDVCREALGDNTEELNQFENFEDALGFAFTLLEETGIEDPEQFLIEKKILIERE